MLAQAFGVVEEADVEGASAESPGIRFRKEVGPV